MTSMQTTTINRIASFGCPQAIAIELREVLPEGWVLAREEDVFVVRGAMKEGWQSVGLMKKGQVKEERVKEGWV